MSPIELEQSPEEWLDWIEVTAAVLKEVDPILAEREEMKRKALAD